MHSFLSLFKILKNLLCCGVKQPTKKSVYFYSFSLKKKTFLRFKKIVNEQKQKLNAPPLSCLPYQQDRLS